MAIEYISEKWLKIEDKLLELIRKFNFVTNGYGNNTGSVTLVENAASTTITISGRFSINSVIGLMPMTSNAAIAKQTIYIENTVDGFIIHHANNSQTDREFKYSIAGT